jgi:cytochrome c peroxidase
MKTKSFLVTAGILLLSITLSISCSKDLDANGSNSTTLKLDDQYNYMMASPAMGQLGRVLFYDKFLSVNNAVSCGSCHLQTLAFSDHGQFSEGFENITTNRNTPPIQNLFEPDQALFWDGRERVLQTMVMKPVFNHVEMGMSNATQVVNKVKGRAYYEELFEKAFGDNEISFNRIAQALGSFTSSIVSQDSRFDQNFMFGFITPDFVNPQMQIPNFTPIEQEGFGLFFNKYNCGSCHNLFSSKGYGDFTSTTAGEELVNIGLDRDYNDDGRGTLTGDNQDNGKFKIPNLRNVELTGPYMHDGRFSTLEEVIGHYSTGIEGHPNLDDRLKDENGKPLVLNITEAEKGALVAFLGTLTDRKFTTDPKFSDPFKKN